MVHICRATHAEEIKDINAIVNKNKLLFISSCGRDKGTWYITRFRVSKTLTHGKVTFSLERGRKAHKETEL